LIRAYPFRRDCAGLGGGRRNRRSRLLGDRRPQSALVPILGLDSSKRGQKRCGDPPLRGRLRPDGASRSDSLPGPQLGDQLSAPRSQGPRFLRRYFPLHRRLRPFASRQPPRHAGPVSHASRDGRRAAGNVRPHLRHRARALMNTDIRALTDQVIRESSFVEMLAEEAGRVIVGQRYMLERVLIGLLCNGHVLLEGVPGLAKTLTVRTLADGINAQFMRVQFTPDLLPADLVGTMIYNQATASFTVRKGP